MNLKRLGLAFGAVAYASSVYAQATIELPAGVGCEFALRIEGVANPDRKDFYDKRGNLVRQLIAGRGPSLTFINADSPKNTLSLQANGSVSHITPNANGTETWVATGHNVLVLFPDDDPSGPATTLYVGRLVFTYDTNTGYTNVVRFNGKSTDICDALS